MVKENMRTLEQINKDQARLDVERHELRTAHNVGLVGKYFKYKAKHDSEGTVRYFFVRELKEGYPSGPEFGLSPGYSWITKETLLWETERTEIEHVEFCKAYLKAITMIPEMAV